MQMLILYCLLNSNEENVSVHMDFFFLNNFDPMLPESMIVGADSSWLPVCGVGADRQTDIVLTSRLCCLQIG